MNYSKHRTAKFLLLLGTATIINFIIFNAIIGNFIYDYPALIERPVLGWGPEENSTKIYGLEGYAKSTFNNYGLRGTHISKKRPEEYRILLIGSSFTFAGEVQEEDTFVSLFQKELRRTNKNLRVINGGIPDSSVADYLFYLPFLKQEFIPDTIIIQLVAKDFLRAITGESGRQVEIVKNNNLIIHHMKNSSLLLEIVKNDIYRYLLDKLPLFSFSCRRLKIYISQLRNHIATFRNAPKNSKKNTFNDDKVEELMKIFFRLLKGMKTPISILLIPGGNIHEDIYESKHEAELTQLLLQYANTNKIHVVNMADPFLNLFVNKKIMAKGFSNSAPGRGHLNAAGHQEVATALYEQIKPTVIQ